ncbi:acetate--CoA ligase family protein [Candidatus Microgenomates bacterium]|nr:acetate--CoA ligase family protein [Candidatus Microgenomates bacterium]
MILFEFEGKKLLDIAGIKTPNAQLIDSSDVKVKLKSPLVLKAQVLSGKRADAGGIIVVDEISSGQLADQISNLLRKEINGEKVEKVLVEEKVTFEEPEYYISVSYDSSRGPILTVSSAGGTGIEDRPSKVYNVDPLKRTAPECDLPEELVGKLINLFFEQDMLLLEINPLVKVSTSTSLSANSSEGIWVALDAKIKLDDSAFARHEDWKFAPRSVPEHTPTDNEIEAKKIDEGDYRGVAGSTYLDLPGDIAILSSGGGVSLTAMDALIAAGGKPANFTEYSGNPPKEKVVKLTKVVLNKPNIHGLWVIGTVAANFTDIYETLSGFIEGLRELKSQGIKLDFPIVIRRGGPRDREAFEMLREISDFNLTLQGEETSIQESAQIMAEKAKEYATTS